jgi:hypothetical protein
MRGRTKLFAVSASAMAVAFSGFAFAGTASAKTPVLPDPARNCSFTATVNFASPGLTHNGSVSPSKVSTSTTTGSSYNCGVDGMTTTPDLSLSSKSTTRCDKKTAGIPIAACVPHDWIYGTALGFATGGTSSLQKAVKKTTITIGTTTYQTKTTSLTAIKPVSLGGAGQCGAEVGFIVSGAVKKPKQDKGQTASLTVCFGSDSGPGTTGSFVNDLVADVGGTVSTIATTTIDPATSKLHIG